MKKKMLTLLIVPLCALIFTGCTLFNDEEDVEEVNGNDVVVNDGVGTTVDDDFVHIDDVIDPEELEDVDLDMEDEGEEDEVEEEQDDVEMGY